MARADAMYVTDRKHLIISLKMDEYSSANIVTRALRRPQRPDRNKYNGPMLVNEQPGDGRVKKGASRKRRNSLSDEAQEGAPTGAPNAGPNLDVQNREGAPSLQQVIKHA